jgi:formylglycine-generating enzyme required for sulfatase activity
LIYADWLEERGDPLAALYRHPRLTNAIGMQLVLIPPGTFLMGSPEAEEDRSADEGPLHEVAITRPFYLGIYPVTQEQFQRVMGTNPSYFCPGGESKEDVAGLDTKQFPVENVLWKNALSFCKKLSALPEEKRCGRVYRLPSEAEWEYCCRGGAPSYQVFHFGNSLSSTQANFDGNSPYGGADAGPYLERPCKVGSYTPNGFGLYDMHGNVWDWCNDWYGYWYYRESPRADPPGPPGGSRRVIRGGSYSHFGSGCRSAYRLGTTLAYRSSFLGFRVALVPSTR